MKGALCAQQTVCHFVEATDSSVRIGNALGVIGSVMYIYLCLFFLPYRKHQNPKNLN